MTDRILRMVPMPAPVALLGHRGRKILHAGMWSLVAKGLAAANLFVSVPFVLSALGPSLFGVWATLVSFTVLAGFLDFGFGNGTMNLIATAHGRDAPGDVVIIVREGYRAMVRIALYLAAAALVALALVPWYRLLGMPETDVQTARGAAAVVMFTIVLAVPLNLANRVQLGLGRGDRAFRWQAAGQLLALVAVIALAKAHASLAMLTAAAVTTPLLASVANTWSLWRDPAVTTPSSATRTERDAIAHQIRSEGVLFFVLQLAAALAYSADLPLISAFRGSTEAGTYAIVQRLFSVIPMSLSLVWAPLWPIYRHALASGHHAWVMRTLRRSMASAVVFAAVCAVVLALGFTPIIKLWVHHLLIVSGMLLGGFALWCVIEAAGTALATFLNAASVMRFQLITASVFAVICFAGKAWIIVRFGITWVPWVSVIAYVLAYVLPLIWYGRRIFANVFARKY